MEREVGEILAYVDGVVELWVFPAFDISDLEARSPVPDLMARDVTEEGVWLKTNFSPSSFSTRVNWSVSDRTEA